MAIRKRRWVVGCLGVLLLFVGVAGLGLWRLKRMLDAGNALNFPPREIATSRPVTEFTGQINLVRGGTLGDFKIGTHDPQSPTWWTPDGTPTTRPKFAATRHELPIALGPAGRVRQLAWTRAERSDADRNVAPSLGVVKPLTAITVHDEAEGDLQTLLFVNHSRQIFQRADDAATFTVRGSIDDHEWQTFAVLTPGGPTQIGPIAAKWGQTPDGRPELTFEGDWAWPTRVVFVTTSNESNEARMAINFTTPFGRSEHYVSEVFATHEIKAAYVQLCGQQRFEIRGLPSDPQTSPRPATLIEERLHPTLPGLTPLADVPPQSITPQEFFRRIELFRTPATQPAGPPSTQAAEAPKRE